MLHVDIQAQVGSHELRVALPAAPGTTVVIGPNGAGKTTLLRCLLGAVRPFAGEIVLDGEPLFHASDNVDIAMEDRRLGYVPQKYALFPHMTVNANVGFGVRDASERSRKVSSLLASLSITHLADRKARALSGGESQRVALARALAIEPRALLLDEPMAALDAGAREVVRDFLGERLRALEIPTLVVSHDVDDAIALGDRIAVIEDGRITQIGTIEELRSDPATTFVEQFLR